MIFLISFREFTFIVVLLLVFLNLLLGYDCYGLPPPLCC